MLQKSRSVPYICRMMLLLKINSNIYLNFIVFVQHITMNNIWDPMQMLIILFGTVLTLIREELLGQFLRASNIVVRTIFLLSQIISVMR